MKKCKPETGTVEHESLINKRVNEIDELYSGPESRENCRESARELHEQTAKFVQKVVKLVDDLKSNPGKDLRKYLSEYLSNCPWPFGLPIIKGNQVTVDNKAVEGEAEYTPIYGSDCTTRELKIPDDISAVHTFLALYRDERLGGDRIVTYEIRNICPELGTCPLIMSNTAEMLELKILDFIGCAREDLDKKKMARKSWRITKLLRMICHGKLRQ